MTSKCVSKRYVSNMLDPRPLCERHPDKHWKLCTVKSVRRRIDETGSAAMCKPDSGRPKAAPTASNIAEVDGTLCSQDDQLGTSWSARRIANELGISERTVRRIAKVELSPAAFRRMAQVLTASVKRKRLYRCRKKWLVRRLTIDNMKTVFFTDEQNFYLYPSVDNQNDRVWASGRTSGVATERLLVERKKLAKHVMVSAEVFFGGFVRVFEKTVPI